MIEIGTKVKLKQEYLRKDLGQDMFGGEFTVIDISPNRVTCSSDDRHSGLIVSYLWDRFNREFDVVSEKNSAKTIGSITESELDRMWDEADSFENFKFMLKFAVNPVKPTKKSRVWSEYKEDKKTGCLYSVSKPDGQSAKVKVNVDGFVGVASCNPNDKFDLRTGIDLAEARARLKVVKATHIFLSDMLTEIDKDYAEVREEVENILNKIYRKAGH